MSEGEEEEFEVQVVQEAEYKPIDGANEPETMCYLVRWWGYGREEVSWEPEWNFDGPESRALLDRFWRSVGVSRFMASHELRYIAHGSWISQEMRNFKKEKERMEDGPGASIVLPMSQTSGTVDPRRRRSNLNSTAGTESSIDPTRIQAQLQDPDIIALLETAVGVTNAGSQPLTPTISAPPGGVVSSQRTSLSGSLPLATDLVDLTDDVGPAISWMSAYPVKINGHFCDLFEGWHLTAGKVALKRPRIGATGYDDVIVRRFEREAATWRNLQHRHILEFLGTFKRDGHIYFVSPFIKNGTLVEYIAEYPNVNRIQLMCQTADAVQYLHKERIVHGDLKANNILIHDDGHCLLCDFGLTKTNDSRTSTAMRGAGTLRWQSPELWDNDPKTFESDVYAFSMTIVEVLTGEAPFAQYANDSAVMRAVLLRDERPSKSPNESSNGISYEVIWEVAAACWPRNPADRLSMSEALKRMGADPSLIQNPTL